MTRRAGAVSLAELVLVVALFALVLGGLSGFVVGHTRMAATQAGEIRLIEAVRAAHVVLGAEMRGLAVPDVAARSADSVRIRAFRGGGAVCSIDGARVAVRYRGVRLPDPEKDSAIVISGAGAEESMGVADAGGAACGGAGLWLTLEAPPSVTPAFALVHEAGAYHLSDGALRYRRGRGGRQPLMEAILSRPAFELSVGAPLRFDAVPLGDSLPRVRRRFTVAAPSLNGWALP